jgi:Spermatogenesis-associated C-terminus
VTDNSLTTYNDDDDDVDDDDGGGDVAREAWKKRYYDEKKKTTPKEEQCTKLRNELEQWHRRIAAQLEAARDTGKRIAGHGVHEQAEMKIRSTKYEQEIEEMHTKLQNIKLRLTTEIKVGLIDILKSISINLLICK